jgi:hypothetical protein
MNKPCPNCVAVEKKHAALKSELEALKAEFEDFKSESEEVARRKQARMSPPMNKPKPGTTRTSFGKM